MKKRRLWYSLLVVFALLFVSACGNNAAQPPSADQSSDNAGQEPAAQPAKDTSKPTIKVGMICGGMTPMLAQIGINDGSFEKAGLNVEKVCFTAGSDAIQALVGGSIDVNLGSYEHILKMQKNGLDVKAYGEIYNGVGYSLVVKKEAAYKTLKDLKGSTLAVTKAGTLSDSGLRRGLEKAGVNPDRDVKIIGAGSGSTMLAAIESGKVAGGMVSEPTLSSMVASGKYRMLYDPDFAYSGIIVMSKADWVSKNQDAMKAFLKELKNINDRSQKDPQSATDAMAKEFTKVPKDVLAAAVKNQLKKVPEGLKVSKDGTEAVNETSIQLKIIDKPIPYEQAVDLSFLP